MSLWQLALFIPAIIVFFLISVRSVMRINFLFDSLSNVVVPKLWKNLTIFGAPFWLELKKLPIAAKI